MGVGRQRVASPAHLTEDQKVVGAEQGPADTLATSTDPRANIPDYPDIKDILRHLRSLPRVLLVETGTLTRRARVSKKSTNLVLIGATAFI